MSQREGMNRISERDRRVLRFGGMAVGAILVLTFAGLPALDQLSARARTLNTRNREIRGIEADIQDALSAGTLLAELKNAATLYPSLLAVQEQPARIQQQVARIPSYGQLSVRRVESVPLRQEEEFYRSAVSLQFQGTLGTLHRFLEQLEAEKPRLRVDRLTVATDQDDPSLIEGNIVITGFAVVIKDDRKQEKKG